MAVTYGAGGSPSQKTINYDALLSAALSKYEKTLYDNVTQANPLFFILKQRGMYQAVNGGLNAQVPVLHDNANFDTYSGYDELDLSPTNGITQAVYDWSEAAVPIVISHKEQGQSRDGVFDLMQAKIMQAENGIKEGFNQSLLQGQLQNDATGDHRLARVSAANGSSHISPLGRFIQIDPTDATAAYATIGNISQSANSWWRNQTVSASGITLYDQLISKINTLYNNCARGVGGPPDLMVTDQTTWELISLALYNRTRHNVESDQNFPFDNILWRRSTRIVWDEAMPDVTNNTLTPDSGVGHIWAINTKFLKIKYWSDQNFVNSGFEDQLPRQNAKAAQILWTGALCMFNRKKHGVLHAIPRTLSVS